ncbi:MAG: hypothetical protein ACYDCQ_21580 [Dehalococcoidia bacterium]
MRRTWLLLLVAAGLLAGLHPRAPALADDSIGGVWSGTTQSPLAILPYEIVPFQARAYPVGNGAAPVDHVNFTAFINGKWIAACTAPKPESRDFYSCDWQPGAGPWTSHDITISFDVYNTVGGVHLAPNGEHVVRFNTGQFLSFPFDPSQAWYVCQGYNGPIDHTPAYFEESALDLSIDPSSPTSGGCSPDSADASTGQAVWAPADGVVSNYFAESDFVCITFDAGGSAAIGHINGQPALKTRVRHEDVIGYVNPPQEGTNQGGYAHIHIQVFTQPDCPGSTHPVPFDAQHNAGFASLGYDLPNPYPNGCDTSIPDSCNQYSGLKLQWQGL